MDSFNAACNLLPQALREDIKRAGFADAEELRLRLGMKPAGIINGRERCFSDREIDEAALHSVLERATGASVHTHRSTIAQGFVACGGLRIGLCGQAAVHEGSFSSFRKLTSLCIRIPHKCRGAYASAAERLFELGLPNTLIVSPAGGGKTTALRDVVTSLSEMSVRVGVIDERYELCGDEPQSLGGCSDVISGLKKHEASLMLLRAVNPQLIAMDEISSRQDCETALNIVGCGSSVIATAHGKNHADMLTRPVYRDLFSSGVFEMILTIQQKSYGRSYTLERICK